MSRSGVCEALRVVPLSEQPRLRIAGRPVAALGCGELLLLRVVGRVTKDSVPPRPVHLQATVVPVVAGVLVVPVACLERVNTSPECSMCDRRVREQVLVGADPPA